MGSIKRAQKPFYQISSNQIFLLKASLEKYYVNAKKLFLFFARLGWKIVVTRNKYRVGGFAWFGWPDFLKTIFTKGATAVTQILQLMIVLSP